VTPERYARVCDLVEAAWDLTREARAALLAQACNGDSTLRHEVEELLEQDAAARAEGFLAPDPPAPDHLSGRLTLPHTDLERSSAAELVPGQRLGPYAIEEKIASGGMGSVYRAMRVEDYRQTVAIKVIKADRGGPEVLRRFQTEGKSLARLVHPGIARLLDGGTTADGRP
jgi:serine/threonine protein kinase